METDYRPSPIDVAGVDLCDELHLLVELLAEHAHDIWALQRIKDGWTFGPERCDRDKRHPCLVPYSELSDAEKAYDRNAVIGTIRAILALGFTVQRTVTTAEVQLLAATDEVGATRR
jgi:ryanodine receptor 2